MQRMWPLHAGSSAATRRSSTGKSAARECAFERGKALQAVCWLLRLAIRQRLIDGVSVTARIIDMVMAALSESHDLPRRGGLILCALRTDLKLKSWAMIIGRFARSLI